MDIALTTRWNAGRHSTGEAMIEEILDLGFSVVELGYDTRLHLVEGIERMVREGAVRVGSLHNFCPLPVSAPQGHPEIYTFASPDRRVRELAVQQTVQTIEFAARIGAPVIVTHCGYVETRVKTRQLVEMVHHGQGFTPLYEQTKSRLLLDRDRQAGRHLEWLAEALEALLPVLSEHQVALCLENLPAWEAMPNELEFERLAGHFQSPWLRYWHDTGHGQIRDNLGFINSQRWLQRLAPHLGGMHLHDVANRIADHTMPPRGDMDFTWMIPFMRQDIARVIEPNTRTPAEEIRQARDFFLDLWQASD